MWSACYTQTVTPAYKKILVVDDDDRIRLFINRLLVGDGHHPLFARDGAEALRVLEIEQPNLILLDLNMPIMGGLEFLQRFDNTHNIPIVIISSAMPAEATVLGVAGFLPKPFSVAGLRAVIATLEPQL